MWLKNPKIYLFIWTLQEKIYFSNNSTTAKKPYLLFGNCSIEELITRLVTDTFFYEPSVDSLKEEDIKFVRKTLKKFKIPYKEDSLSRISLFPEHEDVEWDSS